MNSYELTYIIDAQLAPEIQEDVIAKFLDMLKAQAVEILNVEKWGKKKLAYPIDDRQYGYYLMTQFRAPTEIIPEIEHYLKLSPHIFRYLLLHRDPKTLKLINLDTERKAREAAYSAEKERALMAEHDEEQDEYVDNEMEEGQETKSSDAVDET